MTPQLASSVRLLRSLSARCSFHRPSRRSRSSGIAGTVRDTSNAVLPGVTVEAASPALIEKVRTVVTDGEGRYNIVDLRPGTYVVTFTLPGFTTFRRDGIVLTSGFTATVNADLRVGSLEETITVTGETPLVDTQNVRQQTVVSNDALDALPSSTKTWGTVVALTPGFSGMADVGGQLDQSLGAAFHGKQGSKRQFDGMSIDHASGNQGYIPNSALVEETSIQTSGISAESNADGAVVNMIPKEGGNTFPGSLFGLWTGEQLSGENLTDELRAARTHHHQQGARDLRRQLHARRTDQARSPLVLLRRCANGATGTRWRGCSGTRPRARLSGRPTRRGRRIATSGTSRRRFASRGRRRRATSSTCSPTSPTRASAVRWARWGSRRRPATRFTSGPRACTRPRGARR